MKKTLLLAAAKRRKQSWINRSALVALATIATAFGQSSLSSVGSIGGTVVGSDGTPLPGAHVYAALKALNLKTKTPPTLVTKVANGATASPANTFLIPKLPPGSYVLCAQTVVPGWLDPCHWAANVPVVNLMGQNLTGQTVVMTKGVVVQVRINDPSKLLSVQPSAIVHDVEVVAFGSNNAYYNARIASVDAAGRTQQVTLPFDAPHTLIVRSRQFALTDSNGAAVPTAGHTQPVQVSAGAGGPQFIYTVVSKLH